MKTNLDDASPEELDYLVRGAQKFLAPMEDPRDEERLTPPTNSTDIDYASKP